MYILKYSSIGAAIGAVIGCGFCVERSFGLIIAAHVIIGSAITGWVIGAAVGAIRSVNE
jgi:hypothetical protein